MTFSDSIAEYLNTFVFSLLLGAIFSWIAKRQGYYRLPPPTPPGRYPLSLKSVIIVFCLYLGMTTFIAPILASFVRHLYAFNRAIPSFHIFNALQLFILLGTLLLLYLYIQLLPSPLVKAIFKNRSIPRPASLPKDFFMGVLSWVIAFPLVVAVGQLADLALFLFTDFESYEQVAVRYLKTTLSSPETLTVALFTILIAAPMIEECLFRGFLQTYFKRFLSPKKAIVLSSICFALFHFAPSQGIGNISLLISLFVFALFLGFIYERQASLTASLALHITFNTVSTLRILYFPD